MTFARRLQAGRRGFSLLEVLVAVSILGLALTVILSAQVGLFAKSRRTERLSIATGLARCKMNEVEMKLMLDGYPVIETNDDGHCCNDESHPDYSCQWSIENVELPNLPDLEDTAVSSDDDGLTGMNKMGALRDEPGALGDDNSLAGLASALGADDSSAGMVSMVMSLVYPDLKMMLEASIRRVTVKVVWKDGKLDRELSVTQFVTDPQQGSLDPLAAEGLGAGGSGSGEDDE
ncbi:MAG: type II secretion system protein [Polyangiaceae bacterium]|nr:type II secretion system protein [Polyangiaceae bacterium]